ncbi:hypothetical protein FSP39_011937 [Pinctada imbricata]|uniref:procollagen-proline 4-dioxygenase n=1 Tax=Pinctada imbricata TaxID=66713 RepID=A0AA89BPD8_PINIB|nr:hypothetical protein FSP39_011937 [Pinctada imbricata]
MFTVWYLMYLLACVANLIRCELFSSMAHLDTALYAEQDIAQAIKEYVQEEESRLRQLERVANELNAHSEEVLKRKENYLHNPVNAYLYMKKFTIDWDKDIAPLFQRDAETEVYKKLKEIKEYLPTYEDLNGAVAALLRLQDTYKLNTDDLARGIVGKSQSSSMTAIDCFELGKISYEEEDYIHTSQWMEKALSLLNEEKNHTVQKKDLLDYLAFSVFKYVLMDFAAADCFEIGRQAYTDKDFKHCTMWMEKSLDLEKGEGNKTIERMYVLDYLAYSSMMQGDVRRALILTDELLAIAPYHTRAQNNRRYYERILKEHDEDSKVSEEGVVDDTQETHYRQSEEFQTYESLCRGEDTKVNKDKHRLVCRYHNNNNPSLLIQPIKQEEIFLDPWIVMYYDVMSDSEIKVIKELATPKLDRATVHNAKTGKLETAHYRVSKSAWLKDGDHFVVHRVNNRIQAVTGLTMKTAEDLQIANYGLGGQYEPHFDFARKEEKNAFKSLGTGNRIATWLTYMSDVEAGGATVFPYIGVKLFPKKGAAAFWYNLYRNGDGIYNTRHAACPVLVGHKWVSNKWIHERGQEFRRTCSLNKKE